MNTRQIDRAVRRHVHDFDGVFASDELPSQPRLFVANTRPSTEGGEHWIVIHVDDSGKGCYFDSFGRNPPALFKQYLNKHCNRWTFNDKQFQSAVSIFCVEYCVCYCVLKSRGVDLCGLLSRDSGLNDAIVHEIVCRLL